MSPKRRSRSEDEDFEDEDIDEEEGEDEEDEDEDEVGPDAGDDDWDDEDEEEEEESLCGWCLRSLDAPFDEEAEDGLVADPIDCEECLLTFCCPDCLEQHFAIEHADRGERPPEEPPAE